MHSADTCIIKNMNQTFLGRHTHPHSASCGNTHKKIVSQCRMLLRDAELTSSRMRTATTKVKLRPFIVTNRLQGVLTNIHKYKPFRAFIRKTMWEQHMYTNIVANEASHITLFIYSSNWAMGQMVMDWTEASLMANVFFFVPNWHRSSVSVFIQLQLYHQNEYLPTGTYKQSLTHHHSNVRAQRYSFVLFDIQICIQFCSEKNIKTFRC